MHHIVSKTIYYIVFASLFVLLALTVAASFIDLGAWNVPAALAIAAGKAVLILLYFMHVRYSSALVQLFAAGAFVWLAIMLSFTMTDVWARVVGW